MSSRRIRRRLERYVGSQRERKRAARDARRALHRHVGRRRRRFGFLG
jgi:hypothetical protein